MRMSPGSSSGVSCCDHLIDGRAGRDHHHDAPRTLEIGDERRERLRAGELRRPDDRCRKVSVQSASRFQTATGNAVVLDVQRQVPAHGAEADDAEGAAAHADISRAHDRACSNARSRVRTPSSSPMSVPSVPSPSGTTRADGVDAVNRRLQTMPVRHDADREPSRDSPSSCTRSSGMRRPPWRPESRWAATSGHRRLPRNHPAKRRADGEVVRVDRETAQPRRAAAHLREIEKCASAARHRVSRVQRRSVRAGVARSAAAPAPTLRPHPIGVEDETVREVGQVVQRVERAAPPPHQRGQARQAQRGHGVVEISRRKAR